MANTSQAGIISAIIGNIAINLALNLQKYAKNRLVHLALHGLHAPQKTDYLRYVAVILLFSGQFSTFIAYGLAPASIVSPLGVLAVISNCVIPPLIFDETPSLNNITGTTIALPGILLLILSSPKSNDQFIYPLEFTTKLYLVLLSFTITVCTFIRTTWTQSTTIVLRADAILAAVMGTFCVLSIRCAGTILLSNDDTLGSVLLFLALVIVVTGLLQMLIMASIFERFPIWQAVPHLFAFFTVLVGIGSAVIFHEFADCGPINKLEFITGCLLTIIGVWISAKPRETIPVGVRVKRAAALGAPKRGRKRSKPSASRHRKSKTKSKPARNNGDIFRPRSNSQSSWMSIPNPTATTRRTRSQSRSKSRSRGRAFSPPERQYHSETGRSNTDHWDRSHHSNNRYRRYQYLSRSLDEHHLFDYPEFLIPSRPRSTPSQASIELDEQTILLIPRRQLGYGANRNYHQH